MLEQHDRRIAPSPLCIPRSLHRVMIKMGFRFDVKICLEIRREPTRCSANIHIQAGAAMHNMHKAIYYRPNFHEIDCEPFLQGRIDEERREILNWRHNWKRNVMSHDIYTDIILSELAGHGWSLLIPTSSLQFSTIINRLVALI